MIGLWLGAGAVAHAGSAGASCEEDFAKLARVSDSLGRLLRQEGPKAAELRRLDKLLAVEIHEDLRNVAPEQRARLLKLVEEAERTHHFGKNLGGMEPGNLGNVLTNPEETLRLQLQTRVLNHPLGRFTLRHEFSHLTRMDIGEVAPGAAAKHRLRLLRRHRDWVKLEETRAFGDEYDFIRKAYGGADLAALRRDYPTELSRASRDRLVSAGIIRVEADGSEVIFLNEELIPRVTGDPQLAAAWGEMTVRSVNRIFLRHVEDALRFSREEYIEHALAAPEYQEAFASNAILFKLHRVNLGLGALSLGAGAYVVKEWLSSE